MSMLKFIERYDLKWQAEFLRYSSLADWTPDREVFDQLQDISGQALKRHKELSSKVFSKDLTPDDEEQLKRELTTDLARFRGDLDALTQRYGLPPDDELD